MRGLRVTQLLACGFLLVSVAVWAEAEKTTETESRTSSAKASSSRASDFKASELKASRSIKHGAKKKTADDNKKTADTAKQQVTELNLALPANLDDDAGAVSLGDLTQDLPDLFAPKTEAGRVSFDGSLLVEEDLELNPGAGLGNDGKTSRDARKEETTVLEDIEGAQLNIRLKID